MELILFIALIFLFFSNRSLNNRVTDLEERINRKDQYRPTQINSRMGEYAHPIKPDGSPLPEHIEAKPSFTPDQTPSIPIPQPAVLKEEPTEPAGEFFLYAWFREQTLIKIGSIIFFLGAVWFVSYAIEVGWINEITRIILGLLLAISVYIVGYWRRSAEQTQYQTLTVLGTGIFLGTVIASQFAFAAPVLPAGLAFFLMVISVGYTLFVALQTNTEWLAVVASIAGLFVPFLIRVEEPFPALLLIYVFLLAASFLAIVFFTSWRTVSLTLLIGSALHLSIIANSATLADTTIWFFAVLFSALFCTSTTISVIRTNTPNLFDVVSLSIITLQFILYALTYALLPGLALFVAAAITAFIGYILRMRGADADAVSLYVAVTLICSLVGTAKLFDGFVLTIAYALEALAIYLLSLRLATVERSVIVAASLFVLPLLSGLMDLDSSIWDTGILHPEALGTLTVLITIGFAAIWTLRDPALQAIDWLRHTAGVLLTGWYGFAVASSLVVAGAIPQLDKNSTETILLTIVSIILVIYIINIIPRDSWRAGAFFSLVIPTISALVLFSHPAWSYGIITHQPFFAALFFYAGLIVITIIYWLVSKREPQSTTMDICSYSLVWLTLGYGFVFLGVVWDALLTGDMKRVVTSISFTFLTYLIVNALMLARASAGKVTSLLLALFVPGMLLLESLRFSGWTEGVLSVDAVGLYVTTTILFLLGTTLRQYQDSVTEEGREMLQIASSAIYIIAGALIFALVWIMSQTVFSSEALSVTVALFIYTVTGLFSYSYGRIRSSKVWRRVGVLLLSTVVLRLGLIDVWGMELAWKIVTFLGIGLLFIATALLERSHDKHVIKEDITSDNAE